MVENTKNQLSRLQLNAQKVIEMVKMKKIKIIIYRLNFQHSHIITDVKKYNFGIKSKCGPNYTRPFNEILNEP